MCIYKYVYIYTYMYIPRIYICGGGNGATCLKLAELTGRTRQNTNYLPEAAAGLDQLARANQPSML